MNYLAGQSFTGIIALAVIVYLCVAAFRYYEARFINTKPLRKRKKKR